MRNLASIRTISAIKTHTNADALELAVIDGWTCVVKKGEFKADDVVVYFEIDSFIPTEVAPFLTKPGKAAKTFEGICGERLRTMRLRGELSQGLVLPLSILPEEYVTFPDSHSSDKEAIVGTDVTEILGVKKWEKPLNPNLAGTARGNFPTFIRKTDQQRIQNIFHKLTTEQINDTYEVTLKLDGSSATYYVNGDHTGVCSRNLELKTDESNAENTFVKKYYELDLVGKLTAFNLRTGRNIAFQGELWGAGINGNWEGIADHRYNVFDIFDIDKQGYMSVSERTDLVYNLGLSPAPVLDAINLRNFLTVADFLAYASRGSVYNPVAEGVVFKSITNPDFSFKVINDEYLLNGGE
jgi:RNA ligase (TIGR02306 family)